jgi:hypothetical protein
MATLSRVYNGTTHICFHENTPTLIPFMRLLDVHDAAQNGSLKMHTLQGCQDEKNKIEKKDSLPRFIYLR